MSALGHEQTSRHVRVMSAIPLKADIHQRGLHVRLVPEADMRHVPVSAKGIGWPNVTARGLDFAYFAMVSNATAGFINGVVPYHWTQVVNIKRAVPSAPS